MAWSRPVTLLDRFFIALEKSSAPREAECCIRLVVEADGDIGEDELRRAVEQSAAVHPGARLVLRGFWGWLRWRAEAPAPAVRVIENGATMDVEQLPGSYDFRAGRTAEVILLRGRPARLVLRVHHCIMDGRGCVMFMQDLFRCLRGDKPLGADSPLTWLDFAEQPQQPLAISRVSRAPLITTRQSLSTPSAFLFRQRRIERPASGMLANALYVIARQIFARNEHACEAVFLVPADLRGKGAASRSTGNLASALRISVYRNDLPTQIGERIRERLVAGEPAGLAWQPAWQRTLAPWLPIPVLRLLLRGLRWLRRHRLAGFMYSASVSNVGRLSLSDYQAAGWRPGRIFFVPPGLSTAAMLLVLTGTDDYLDITVRASVLANDQASLEMMLDNLASALAADTVTSAAG